MPLLKSQHEIEVENGEEENKEDAYCCSALKTIADLGWPMVIA